MVLSLRFPPAEERQQVVFRRGEDYTEQVFPLQTIRGRAHLRLVFLPGARFDLAYLRFLPAGTDLVNME